MSGVSRGVKPHHNEVKEQIDFAASQSDACATPGFRLAWPHLVGEELSLSYGQPELERRTCERLTLELRTQARVSVKVDDGIFC
jgi:hypothetical protein